MVNRVLKIGIIVFARASSKRLPGKALIELSNKRKLIEIVLSNLANNEGIEIVLATSDEKSDDELAMYVSRLGYKVFRGSLYNVSKRALDCALINEFDYFIRVNGDSPFLKFDILNKAIQYLKTLNVDFVTNLYPRSFPYGISIEIISTGFYSKCLETFKEDEVEHITTGLYRKMNEINYMNISNTFIYDQNINLTLDTPFDLDRLNTILKVHPNVFDYKLEEILSIYAQYL
jgi:spore coat polysaccharide biosynthesis protein SpsF